jgi:hypothetical protein
MEYPKGVGVLVGNYRSLSWNGLDTALGLAHSYYRGQPLYLPEAVHLKYLVVKEPFPAIPRDGGRHFSGEQYSTQALFIASFHTNQGHGSES